MGRSYSLQDFTLETTQLQESVGCQHRHVFVAAMPAAAIGLVTVGIEGGPQVPVYPGYRFTSADPGNVFRRVTVQGPVIGGTVTLVYSNDDMLPWGSGSGGSEVLPFVEAVWTPHRGAANGAAAPPEWLLRGGAELGVAGVAFWANVMAGAGLTPIVDRKAGTRAVGLRPNGGTSGLRFLPFEPSWQRLRVDAGRGPTGRPRRPFAVMRFAVEIGKEAAGGANNDSGLYVGPSNGTLIGGPTGNAHFGCYDAAGAKRFRARAVGGGPLTIDDPISMPSEVSFVELMLELLDADPVLDRDGEVRLYVNGALTKRYTDMAAFPAVAAGPATATGYQIVLADTGASANAHFVRRALYQQGPLGMAA